MKNGTNVKVRDIEICERCGKSVRRRSKTRLKNIKNKPEKVRMRNDMVKIGEVEKITFFWNSERGVRKIRGIKQSWKLLRKSLRRLRKSKKRVLKCQKSDIKMGKGQDEITQRSEKA